MGILKNNYISGIFEARLSISTNTWWGVMPVFTINKPVLVSSERIQYILLLCFNSNNAFWEI